jgi:hypothetical protein
LFQQTICSSGDIKAIKKVTELTVLFHAAAKPTFCQLHIANSAGFMHVFMIAFIVMYMQPRTHAGLFASAVGRSAKKVVGSAGFFCNLIG